MSWIRCYKSREVTQCQAWGAKSLLYLAKSLCSVQAWICGDTVTCLCIQLDFSTYYSITKKHGGGSITLPVTFGLWLIPLLPGHLVHHNAAFQEQMYLDCDHATHSAFLKMLLKSSRLHFMLTFWQCLHIVMTTTRCLPDSHVIF